MKCKREYMQLYAVTDRMWTGEKTLLEQVEAALQGGATCVQLREKELDEAAFLGEAHAMKALCRKYGVPFFINDNVKIAIACGADGIHVGQDDMDAAEVRRLVGEEMMIGVSVNCVEQALAAVQAGADCLGVGAMFSTATKQDADSVSMDTLREICAAVEIPVVAIGGISRENMTKLQGTGVDGVALVSAIFAAADIEAECKALKQMTEIFSAQPKGRRMQAVLTIAGSDCSGGAGIQADLKTMTMNGVYGMSAITALTAQNTTGVQGISAVSPAFLAQQLDSIFTDIRPDAVKIGMVSSAELIGVIAEKLQEYGAEHIVVDPVMVATSGAALLEADAVSALTEKLLPLAAVVTPNIPEGEILSGMTIETKEDMEQAAERIGRDYGCAVLLKGGHSINDANDLLYAEGNCIWFRGKRIANPNTHGTGCTLSSAIASNLAKGYNLEEAIDRSKAYLSTALEAMLDLGAGSGPMQHNAALTGKFAETR
ncbi:MAG: bifunctional hydroxymethylpyrimidine kinase/phosphomethylpyrimidine kinase [Bacillota bacterium]|nr:bifunctional hydroxymethylpyrimidine kinase/phosphomethylpyrimidine kinase [Bacillota bacterium]